jgi:hypothetical protein
VLTHILREKGNKKKKQITHTQPVADLGNFQSNTDRQHLLGFERCQNKKTKNLFLASQTIQSTSVIIKLQAVFLLAVSHFSLHRRYVPHSLDYGYSGPASEEVLLFDGSAAQSDPWSHYQYSQKDKGHHQFVAEAKTALTFNLSLLRRHVNIFSFFGAQLFQISLAALS